MKKILRTLILLICASCMPSKLETGQAEIFYFPIGSQTYSAVTPSNIVEVHTRYARIEVSDPNFQRLLALIDKGERKRFDRFAVRTLIIISKNKKIYLDNYGTVKRKSIEYSIDKEKLDSARKLLEQITKPRKSY